MKIAVAGTGYVGLSLATLLAQHNEVKAVDIIPEKVELINNKKSPIQDDYIEKYLAEKDLNLVATLDAEMAYKDAEFVIIAAPTNYDSKKNFFDTSAVETVIKLVMQYNPNAIMVIKSTIPVGYTKSIREKTGSKNIIVLAAITITPALVMAVTACLRTPSSCWRTMQTYRKTSSKRLLKATEHVKTSSLSVCWKLPVVMKQMLNMMHRRKAKSL